MSRRCSQYLLQLAGLVLSLCLVIGQAAYSDSNRAFPGKGSFQAWQKANVFFNEANALGKSGKYEAEMAKLQKAISIYPFDSAYYHNLGVSHRDRDKKGDLQLAEKAYRQAISLEPSAWEYWFNLGGVLYSQDKNEESIKALRKALSLNPPPDKVEVLKRNINRVLAESKR